MKKTISDSNIKHMEAALVSSNCCAYQLLHLLHVALLH